MTHSPLSPTYRAHIQQLHQRLGIPENYALLYGLALQPEAVDLVDAGLDCYGRSQRLTTAAFEGWCAMRHAAAQSGIVLLMVSAFRSVDYQTQLIEKKISRGLTLDEILTVSAAPGYSEHHTGRALDLTTTVGEALTESFENTAAFHWLVVHAGEYGFKMSYPRDAHSKIGYEPWHWAWESNDGEMGR